MRPELKLYFPVERVAVVSALVVRVFCRHRSSDVIVVTSFTRQPSAAALGLHASATSCDVIWQSR